MARPVVLLENITKTYRMGEMKVPALKGISLSIAHGEFVAVMGTSGSGKSTLMNILGCLDTPTGGRYALDGQDVTALDARALARKRNTAIGFVFQQFNLLARTSAVENVELPLLYAGVAAPERRARAVAALERVGLADRLDHQPHQLSGGQQQRVAIARALVGRPRLLFADEPTGNLDSTNSAAVVAMLQELEQEGLTIILVTHDAEIAAFAARVITLRDGIVASDRRRRGRTGVEVQGEGRPS
ncbi:MAG TPA: ABC transporter ATP-binding protein [Polyangia bacterium]|nr:ABC transporter ATP-binding protein [Polyangia bacterium]